MEFSVSLANLPASVVFPERLRERVEYRAAVGKLVYRGFMTKSAYDELSSLSDDLEYHRALETLFVRTSAEIAPPPARRGPLPTVFAVALGLAALLLAVYWFGLRRGAADPSAASDSSVAASTTAR